MKGFMKLKGRRHKKKSLQREQNRQATGSIEMMETSAEASSNQGYEGKLSKYTNIMKRWQHRWFILDHCNGVLKYYLSEKQRSEAPRGWIYIGGALVSPSDEDSITFTIYTTIEEQYKLRAENTKSRQEWVSRLRQIAEAYASSVPPQLSIEQLGRDKTDNKLNRLDALSLAKIHLKKAETSRLSMQKAIEALPSTGSEMTHTDSNLLVLKSVSLSMISALDCCSSILDQLSDSSSRTNRRSSRRKKS